MLQSSSRIPLIAGLGTAVLAFAMTLSGGQVKAQRPAVLSDAQCKAALGGGCPADCNCFNNVPCDLLATGSPCNALGTTTCTFQSDGTCLSVTSSTSGSCTTPGPPGNGCNLNIQNSLCGSNNTGASGLLGDCTNSCKTVNACGGTWTLCTNK